MARKVYTRRGSPHTRGGVPPLSVPLVLALAKSPHAWGCTELTLILKLRDDEVPTRVGVYRSRTS